jgi:hypothetical protein
LTSSVVVVGCKDRLYDFGVEVVGDGAVVIHPDGSSSGDAIVPDGSSHSGTGGTAGTGGSGGRAGSDGGVAGHAGSDGGTNLCDNTSPDRQTDISNCGTCFHSCLVANSYPMCMSGQCKYTCFQDFYDADKDPSNGCECVKTNGGVEACDGIDNNCDGNIDEGFNFMTDTANCGGCNVTCSYPFATASCTNGACTMGACLPGYYDRDPSVPGCETSCNKTNGGVEICDGLDNDCNGVVDDNAGPANVTCLSKGVCAGTQPVCMGQNGWTCTYPSTYQTVEDTTKGCDGLDNDCDGAIDEPFQIGKTCQVGTGPCAGTGTWVCDNTMTGGHRCMGSMKPPGVETCNGLDDDCDGKVDELTSMSDKTSDDVLVYFPAKNVTIFAVEASRYDATSSDYGFDSTRRPCAVKGKLPWTNVTKEEAEAACEKIGSGWRLCTSAEWQDACNGSGGTTFPYGNAYMASVCNGWDYPRAAGATTLPTASATMCISDLSSASGDELFDMSGNVKEWVLSSTTTTGPYEMRGGAYDIASFTVGTTTTAPGLQCDATIPAPATAVRLPSVGFRCCLTGQLPP